MAAILVVEDNKDLNQVYKLILERAGHTVRTVFDGAEALRMLAVFQPDIILLDLIMPRKTGLEFLQEARLDQTCPHGRVILFTNLDHSQEINSALKEGAYRCAIKARTTPEGLVKLVDRTLREPAPSAQVNTAVRHEFGLSRFRARWLERQRHFE